MKVKFLKENATLPTKGSIDSAGYDLYAAIDEDLTLPPNSTKKVSTGLAMAIPQGYFGAIFARSGLATKKSLRPANCVGVIDADYRGEVIVALHNDSEFVRIIEKGERIAQLVILPYATVDMEIVDDLDKTERGTGGFGSTGTK